ncbi:MAG: AbrB/MazE/SpoVT family DNA-binding domain-containing protein [Deltaproteobacteria bacterium]|nr:AbrB/MazE/SpoVT family DNA-binding domain-containing protein [Deltaproteobacteria bacterium]
METTVQKWGNSLGLRIPKAVAEEIQLKAGIAVRVSVRGDEIIIRPLRRAKFKLSSLLRKVSKKNLHGEVSTGEPIGQEAW